MQSHLPISTTKMDFLQFSKLSSERKLVYLFLDQCCFSQSQKEAMQLEYEHQIQVLSSSLGITDRAQLVALLLDTTVDAQKLAKYMIMMPREDVLWAFIAALLSYKERALRVLLKEGGEAPLVFLRCVCPEQAQQRAFLYQASRKLSSKLMWELLCEYLGESASCPGAVVAEAVFCVTILKLQELLQNHPADAKAAFLHAAKSGNADVYEAILFAQGVACNDFDILSALLPEALSGNVRALGALKFALSAIDSERHWLENAVHAILDISALKRLIKGNLEEAGIAFARAKERDDQEVAGLIMIAFDFKMQPLESVMISQGSLVFGSPVSMASSVSMSASRSGSVTPEPALFEKKPGEY